MKQSKDPFEVAFEEGSPPDSPLVASDGGDTQTHNQPQSESAIAPPAVNVGTHEDDDYDEDDDVAVGNSNARPANSKPLKSGGYAPVRGKSKEEEEEEEDENMDVELSKLPSSADPDKMSKMQAILSQFTDEQMSRYESFRRSGFQKANMKRLLASITGTAKISVPMTIVVSGIAKMFVGELVETARIVMTERKDSGPIRPCHIREAFRRLKLEGKIPKKSVPRLFR